MSDGPPPTCFGRDPAEIVSALQKSIRRGHEEDALAFAVELDRSGFGAWTWKRLRVMASEDVGIAQPGIAAEIDALHRTWVDLRKAKDRQESERLMLVHATILLARTRKSRIVDHALIAFYADEAPRPIPDVALDKHTLAGKRMGRGWEHFWEQGTLLADAETGELSTAPVCTDRYRERAEAATAKTTQGVQEWVGVRNRP
jgi:replication-associated recombination protein RarA